MQKAPKIRIFLIDIEKKKCLCHSNNEQSSSTVYVIRIIWKILLTFPSKLFSLFYSNCGCDYVNLHFFYHEKPHTHTHAKKKLNLKTCFVLAINQNYFFYICFVFLNLSSSPDLGGCGFDFHFIKWSKSLTNAKSMDSFLFKTILLCSVCLMHYAT